MMIMLILMYEIRPMMVVKVNVDVKALIFGCVE
jgi:hypothetical protein